ACRYLDQFRMSQIGLFFCVIGIICAPKIF
ncbi:MAG: hypothetical protein ACI9WC_001617, partial [Arenicella sp.]